MVDIQPHLSVVGFAQADDATTVVTIDEGGEIQPITQWDQGALPGFAVIVAGIRPDQRFTPGQGPGGLQCHTMLRLIDGVLAGIAGRYCP